MEVQTVNKKLIRGFLTLTFRRALLYVVSFVTINLILARILPPATIGIFNIANAIIAFFTFFSDIGLAAAIIQKRDLTAEDLKTTFTIQEILALIITIIVWFFAPDLATWYSLDVSSVWLIRALAAGFFMTSLKVVPSVILERNLDFAKLVWVEILETLAFNGVLIYLSYRGLGVDAFSYSAVIRGVVGVTAIYIIAPWKVGFGFSKEAAKGLLNFGVPFQLNSLLALLKDRLVPLVIAQMVGATGIGFITWAQNLAFLPIEVMNIIIRVTFPAYSRLQDDRFALKITLERSIFLTGLFLFPLSFGVMAIAPSLIKYVVRNDWQPALPMVYLFSINVLWASLSTTFTNVLNAIGKIKVTLKLMVMWTILTWILTPILTFKLGFIGVAWASAIIAFTSIIPILIIKREVDVKIIENVWQTLLASALMGVVVFLIASTLIFNLVSLLIAIAIGGLVYALLIIVIAKEKVIKAIKAEQHETVL